MRYNQSHVGMVHYCSYWQKYSLILNVGDFWITELDAFNEINSRVHKIRIHCTPLARGDRFYTVQEFYQLLKDKEELCLN